MENYKNLSGQSSVSKYEIGEDCIVVLFADGKSYKYTCNSAGAGNIERMKNLAMHGSGLNAFIMANVKKNYESKW